MTQENVFTLNTKDEREVLVEFDFNYKEVDAPDGNWLEYTDFEINWIEDAETNEDITRMVILKDNYQRRIYAGFPDMIKNTVLSDLRNQIDEYINENINEWVEDERHYQRTEE